MISDEDSLEAILSSFAVGALMSLVFFGMIFMFSNNCARAGYFYVTSESNGAVIRMDDSSGSATTITKPMDPNEAIRICNEMNHAIIGHTN